MSNQNLIIYKFNLLYNIFEELGLELNFNIICVDSENALINQIKSIDNYIIISNKNNLADYNQFVLKEMPISIFKLIEKINIEFIKSQFNNQSQLKINNYIIDLNSREMISKNSKLKLTEKETNTIIYLSKKNKAVSVDELQEDVWSYQPDIETHTVETHIYRLRKKILNIFHDNDFIISEKNGYKIK